jgi:hypothetical protein
MRRCQCGSVACSDGLRNLELARPPWTGAVAIRPSKVPWLASAGTSSSPSLSASAADMPSIAAPRGRLSWSGSSSWRVAVCERRAQLAHGSAPDIERPAPRRASREKVTPDPCRACRGAALIGCRTPLRSCSTCCRYHRPRTSPGRAWMSLRRLRSTAGHLEQLSVHLDPQRRTGAG